MSRVHTIDARTRYCTSCGEDLSEVNYPMKCRGGHIIAERQLTLLLACTQRDVRAFIDSIYWETPK